ncbi:MAG TPA: RsmG family class I SAM-dependent methyltransferase [Acidimicrobiales bacterium]
MRAELEPLRTILREAQRLGVLGPEDIETHVAHALDYFTDQPPPPGARCIDLGSGAGIPGLPLALAYPATRWTLIDGRITRCDRLRDALRQLGLAGRVDVVHGRAEELGHGPLRGQAEVVVARGFGAPPITAECAAPFVRPGGLLIVSVARETTWPDEVSELGLRLRKAWQTERGRFRSYELVREVESRFPRRPTAQRRKPLF